MNQIKFNTGIAMNIPPIFNDISFNSNSFLDNGKLSIITLPFFLLYLIMSTWVKIGNVDIIFPNEKAMLKVLKDIGLSLDDVIIVEKRD